MGITFFGWLKFYVHGLLAARNSSGKMCMMPSFCYGHLASGIARIFK